MVNLFVNDIEVQVPKNSTILQACDEVGIDIPRFCFHERLLVAGNCRMCLVEIEKSPKPVPGCTIPVMENMKVYTKTPLVKKAQEAVLEFLLINHPLDCPICDQAGECDLQDQSLNFGSDSSRFYIKKRGVEDKNLGPIVKTVMTRCIHCTRCVRFATEVAGVKDLGTTGRGKKTEIGTYVSKLLDTEIAGNIIDLCPVGALTSKVYAFKARPWELKTQESIDILDSLGSNILVQSKGNEVVRVLPRLNEDINEEWLSDKARYSFDSLNQNRIVNPLMKISGKFNEITWETAFSHINQKLSNLSRIKNINDIKLNVSVSKLADLDTSFILQEFVKSFKGLSSLNIDKKFIGGFTNKDLTSNLRSESIVSKINDSDFILFVNPNLKECFPLLLTKLRKHISVSGSKVYTIGNNYGQNYNHLGFTWSDFLSVLEGRNLVVKNLLSAKNPLILLDNSCLNKDTHTVSEVLLSMNNDINFCILNEDISHASLLELGYSFHSENDLKSDINIDIGSDIQYTRKPMSQFNIFIGSHGFMNLNDYDLILPSLTYLEKDAYFMNFDGFIQKSNKVSTSNVQAKSEYTILKTLLLYLSKENEEMFFTKSGIAEFLLDKIVSNKDIKMGSLKGLSLKYSKPSLGSNLSVFTNVTDKYYLSNAISQSSKVMVECQSIKKRKNF